jgi:nicotinamidase-related amidase
MCQAELNNQKLLDVNDCVLIVIDVQDKLLPQIAYKERLIKNIVTLVKFAEIINLPIVWTEQDNLGPTNSEIKDELTKLKPFNKLIFNCFGIKPFEKKLKELKRNTLIITGMETHICVTQTALHALTCEPNYTVHIISDAVSSRNVDNWRVGLDRLHTAGAVISSTEMVIFELLRQAGTDEFRATLPMVK